MERINFQVSSRKTLLLLLLPFFFLIHSCALSYDERGRFHRVRNGETLVSIASGYRLPLKLLASENELGEEEKIKKGQKLYLPERPSKPRFKRLPLDKIIAKELKKERRRQEKSGVKVSRAKSSVVFRWPVNGPVTSGFGMRKGTFHYGIDIKAKVGASVHAAAAGEVKFSGKMRGYGNIILIQHKDNYFTSYAHNQKNLVRKGESVSSGQQVAMIGQTGRTTGAHLHFEVNDNGKPKNPLSFLPVIR